LTAKVKLLEDEFNAVFNILNDITIGVEKLDAIVIDIIILL
jgi:hypothetical protein